MNLTFLPSPRVETAELAKHLETSTGAAPGQRLKNPYNRKGNPNTTQLSIENSPMEIYCGGHPPAAAKKVGRKMMKARNMRRHFNDSVEDS